MMSQNASAATLRIQALSKTSPKVAQRSMSKMSNGRTTLEYKKEMCPKETVLRKLYENAKCKVPNSMIEICVMDSKNHVMCNGRGSLEEQ